MRVRSIVLTVLAGVSAVAVPAAAMEVAKPPRPHVAKAPAVTAGKRPAVVTERPVVVATRPVAAAEKAPATTAVRAATVPTPPPDKTAATREPVVSKPEVERPELKTPSTVAPTPEKQVLRLACQAGRPDGTPAVRCQWSPADRADHYVLYRKAGDAEPERIYSGTDTSHVDRTVTEGSGYGFGVKAIDGAGRVIGTGGLAWVRCCGEPAPEKQVLRLACQAGRPDGTPAVRCQWSPADRADHYVLYRKAGDADPERIYTGTDTSFVDRTVTEGTGYGYGVKAIDATGRVIGMGGLVWVRCCPVDGA